MSQKQQVWIRKCLFWWVNFLSELPKFVVGGYALIYSSACPSVPIAWLSVPMLANTVIKWSTIFFRGEMGDGFVDSLCWTMQSCRALNSPSRNYCHSQFHGWEDDADRQILCPVPVCGLIQNQEQLLLSLPWYNSIIFLLKFQKV